MVVDRCRCTLLSVSALSLMAMAPEAAGAAVPPQVPELGYGWALLKMILALVIVCGLAYVLLRYGLRRLASPRLAGDRRLKVIERCPLVAGRSLWIVQAGSRYFLLGEAEGGISHLAELRREEIEAAATSEPFSAGSVGGTGGGGIGRSFLELVRGKRAGGGG